MTSQRRAAAALLLPAFVAACAPTPAVTAPAAAPATRPASDPLLVDVLGTPVDGPQWAAMAARYAMTRVVEKGDPGLQAWARGVVVISRDRRTWRVALELGRDGGPADRPFAGPLPLGVTAAETQASLVAKLGPPARGRPIGSADNQIAYVRGGTSYAFSFRDADTLESVLLERVESPAQR